MNMVDALPWWRWLLLILFFGGLGIAWWWAKRGEIQSLLAGKRPEPRLKVLERRYLGPKAFLLLVEIDGQNFLLAQTGTSAAWQPLATTAPAVTSVSTEKKVSAS